MAMVDDQSKTCIVLGGRSFVGRSLVARLLKLGFWIVRVADSTQSLQLDPDDHDYDVPLDRALSTGRAFYFHVDVRNKKSVINAIEGSSVVFYVNDDSSCNHDFFSGYTIIVQGVKNVISACQECKVKRLIYNSTADVVLDNSHDIHNGNETLLYATTRLLFCLLMTRMAFLRVLFALATKNGIAGQTKNGIAGQPDVTHSVSAHTDIIIFTVLQFKNVYSELKAQAEATVLLANDMDGLLTCALRPSNVFGPRDEQLLPSLVDVAKSSWAKFIIGSDVSMCDYTYMENVAHALICAEAALVSHMVTVSGKAFFVTNLEPMSSWEFSLRMLEGLGYYRPMVKIPDVVVRLMVYLIKVVHLKTNSRHNSNSSVHNIVRLISHTTTYDCSAAQHHLEYSPVVSLDEGITSTIESFSHLAKDSSVILDEFYEQSKIAQLLGGGDVAEILLWRDERKSFFCFCGVVSLFYWFFLCERTAVSSAAQLLLLVTVFLYGYSLMSTEMSSYSHFEVSEKGMRNFVTNIVSIWNGVSHVIKSLAQVRSWSFFLKVAVPLYFFKLFLVNYFPISLGLALAFSFILLFIFEQYEEEINGLIGILNELTRQYVVSEISLLLMNTSTRPSMSKDVR